MKYLFYYNSSKVLKYCELLFNDVDNCYELFNAIDESIVIAYILDESYGRVPFIVFDSDWNDFNPFIYSFVNTSSFESFDFGNEQYFIPQGVLIKLLVGNSEYLQSDFNSTVKASLHSINDNVMFLGGFRSENAENFNAVKLLLTDIIGFLNSNQNKLANIEANSLIANNFLEQIKNNTLV